METKKISFGFSKIAKKVNLQAGLGSSDASTSKQKAGDKIELISCLEGQAIKIVGKEDGDDKPPPLVIPLREQDKTTIPGRLAKLQEIKEGKDVEDQKNVKQELVPIGKETLEQQAAREILESLKESNQRSDERDTMVVALKPEDLPLDGGRESSISDYDSVPIEKFGMAMLRGMGWKEDPNAPKKDDKLPEGPVQRPKGMGLGAERLPKDKNKQLIPPAKDEVLAMRKGAYVKVLAGKHKDAYGTVESLDEDTSRALVCFALGGNQESLNEYLLQLVSKAEYSKYSKVLNSAKYEEYKNRAAKPIVKEEKQEERKIKREPSDSPPPNPQVSRSDRNNEVHYRQHRDRAKNSPSRDDRHNRAERHDRDGHDSRRDREHNDSRERQNRSHDDPRDRGGHRRDNSDEGPDEPVDRNRSRHHHKSSSYARTSSGSKKKSHKYKQRRDHSRERGHSSDEDDKRHKKKTKKSKKQRSRSRSRR